MSIVYKGYLGFTTGGNGTFTGGNFVPNAAGDTLPLFIANVSNSDAITLSGASTWTAESTSGGFVVAASLACAAGSQSITFTFTAGYLLTWLLDYSGVNSVTASTPVSVPTPGTGTGAIQGTSVSVPTGSVLVAICYNNNAGTNTITSPAGTIRENGLTSNSFEFCITEYAGAGSNITPTFTSADGATENFVVMQLVLTPTTSQYSGVNQLDYSVVTGSNSLTTTGGAGVGTLAVTAGNLLVAVCYSANIINATFSDSSGNPWSRYNSNFAALNGTAGLAGYWCIASTTGTPTFTLAASGLSYAIYVDQFQIVQNGALIAASGNYQASIGSGSQNATSGNVAVGTTNNLGFAFCLDKAGTLSPASGTGPGVTMNGGTAVWQTWGAGGVAVGKPANGLSTGTGPFTFTTNNPGDAVLTLGAAFSLQPFSLYPIRRVRRQLFTTYYPV